MSSNEVFFKVPFHSLPCLYLNCACIKAPPSSTVAVIAGAVNETFSAIILLISEVKACFKDAGSFATITSSVPPSLAYSAKFFIPDDDIPPPYAIVIVLTPLPFNVLMSFNPCL